MGCEDGTMGGYAGDVWFPQPPPADHPWRSMPWHGMTPHMSGTSLSAQMRYADGVREILENHMAGKPIREEYQIVTDGALAGMGAHSCSKGHDLSPILFNMLVPDACITLCVSVET